MSGIHSRLAIHGPTLGATPVKGAGDSPGSGGAWPPASGTGPWSRDQGLVLWRQLVQSGELPDVHGYCRFGGEREQRLREYADRLAAPTRPPATRQLQQGAGGNQRWTCVPQLVIVDEASMAPPRTSTTSPPSQHGQGRRAPATLTSNTYLQHGRVESGTREDMLDLLFEPGSPTRAPVGSRR